jgi:hypothetical protein
MNPTPLSELFTEYAHLRTFDDVKVWCRDNGGEEALRAKLARRGLDLNSVAVAEAWLEHQEQLRARRATDEQLVLTERSTKAAEASAKAAHDSAVWAKWAAIIAVAALFVSGWQYLGRWLE